MGAGLYAVATVAFFVFFRDAREDESGANSHDRK
jgi:hypothetical protein